MQSSTPAFCRTSLTYADPYQSPSPTNSLRILVTTPPLSLAITHIGSTGPFPSLAAIRINRCRCPPWHSSTRESTLHFPPGRTSRKSEQQATRASLSLHSPRSTCSFQRTGSLARSWAALTRLNIVLRSFNRRSLNVFMPPIIERSTPSPQDHLFRL